MTFLKRYEPFSLITEWDRNFADWSEQPAVAKFRVLPGTGEHISKTGVNYLFDVYKGSSSQNVKELFLK